MSDETTRMSPAERLAHAVLLFHRGGEWTATDAKIWHGLTGYKDATAKVLCDLARRTRDSAARAP